MIGRYDYRVREDGKRDRVVETDDQGHTTTIDWVYDQLGRLTEERYDFDHASDPQLDDDYDTIARYGFDLASNRLQLAKDLGNATGAFAADQTITYDYDDNDRLLSEALNSDGDPQIERTTTYEYGGPTNPGTEQTRKTVSGDVSGVTTQTYNLQGRLATLASDADADGHVESRFTYRYNDAGIRVYQKQETDADDDGTIDDTDETDFLIDANNPTGFAQVLEEKVHDQYLGMGKTFTLGLNVISEYMPWYNSGFLLYDGHGSTRVLLDYNGVVQRRFAYDAYGNLLGGAGLVNNIADALTTHLYSGERTDPTGLQYLRARYYDPTTGRFNRLDPFAGDTQDPISLHKYLYTHANPVMGVDPTGLYDGLVGQMNVMSVMNNFLATTSKVYSAFKRAKNVLDAIETASTIIGLAQADWGGLLRQGMSMVSCSMFGEYASRFTKRGIERALLTLMDNIPLVTTTLLGSPSKMQAIATAIVGPKPAFIIYLPTPPFANPLAAIPPIPIPLKLGRLRFQVYLSFGIRSYTGMFTGLAISEDSRQSRFDHEPAKTEGVFHMDYVVHHPRGGSPPSRYDLAHWLSEDEKFEFHVPGDL
ncbi:MAG: RHS repeat-associated core domain-containing protein [Pirellulales bacterium]